MSESIRNWLPRLKKTTRNEDHHATVVEKTAESKAGSSVVMTSDVSRNSARQNKSKTLNNSIIMVGKLGTRVSSNKRVVFTNRDNATAPSSSRNHYGTVASVSHSLGTRVP